MAQIANIVPAYYSWLKTRPEVIQALAAAYPPNLLYKMSTGHRVTICSYCEDGTVTVRVTGEYNLVSFEREVFGVDPKTLKECDLPKEDERLGVMVPPEAQHEYIGNLKELFKKHRQNYEQNHQKRD